MGLRKIIGLFKIGNVVVCGPKGSGKDVLFGNVIARRKQPYVSNLDYTKDDRYHELDFDKIDAGKNTYKNLIDKKVKYYKYPYPMGSDVYISDAGVYLPSQYCNELNKLYPHLPTYFALCRQISRNAVHVNTQHLARPWDKIREQSADTYIRCRWCFMLFGKLVYKITEKHPKAQWLKKIPLLTFQKVTLYDKYQSALDRVTPCRIGVPIMASREVKLNAQMYVDKFRNTYGMVRNMTMIYFNKSKHDTYYFEELFEKGEKHVQENQELSVAETRPNTAQKASK